MRKRINDLVGDEAVGLVENAISEPTKGHVSTAMKYLFEMIGLYPASGEEAMPSEDSLAKTLLQRLGVAGGAGERTPRRRKRLAAPETAVAADAVK